MLKDCGRLWKTNPEVAVWCKNDLHVNVNY